MGKRGLTSLVAHATMVIRMRKNITSSTGNMESGMFEEYRRFYRRRKAEKQKQLEKAIEEARLVAVSAAKMLKERFGVERVMVFGSLTRPSLFHLNSDVDLAVWGLAEKDYYRAVGILQSLHPPLSIDLVRIEDAPPALQSFILDEGEEL